MFQLSNPADVKVFRPRFPRPESGMMKRKVLAGREPLHGGAVGEPEVHASAFVSSKKVPGVTVKPNWVPSTPSDVNGAAGLPRFGRSFPPRPSPKTSNP